MAAFIEVVPFQATNETVHFLRILLDFFSGELISFLTADAKSYQTKFSTSYLQAFPGHVDNYIGVTVMLALVATSLTAAGSQLVSFVCRKEESASVITSL